MADRDRVVLWPEGEWRCELYPQTGGLASLRIFKGQHLIVIEPTFVGQLALNRAEILRTVFCGPLPRG